jgi:hypothetical protein
LELTSLPGSGSITVQKTTEVVATAIYPLPD